MLIWRETFFYQSCYCFGFLKQFLLLFLFLECYVQEKMKIHSLESVTCYNYVFKRFLVMSKVPSKKTAFQGRAKQILIRIADNGSLTTTDLVDMLGMTRPNTCTYLARLKEEEFIETKQGISDKRIRYHSLMMKGREYMDSWSSEQMRGRETFTGYKDHAKSELRLVTDSEEESVDDLLDDCDKIVYDNEFSVETDKNMMAEF